MKRKIPVFKINAKSGASFRLLTEIPELKNIVIEETLVAIKEGIKMNKKSIPLFEIAGSNCYVELKKDNWKSSLENVSEYYLEREDYDKCIECRDLIYKL